MDDIEFKTVSVVGLGYIGLPTAAMFAARKVNVIGVDTNQTTVDTINRGEVHIVEPDLDIAVRATVSDGFLRATTEPEPADAFLMAVPTPFKGENHDPDLSFIEAATQAIAPVLRPGNLVVLESTSPVGTTEQMAQWLAKARPDLTFPQTHGESSDIRIAHCPERVLPGKIMQELVSNDRVIGGMTPRCSDQAAELYKNFVSGTCVISSNPRVAEFSKLAENTYRDVNVALANEFSVICDDLDINVWEMIRLANRHPRVEILRPGPGVGGHCIAVDPWFIVHSNPDAALLIRQARETNDKKPVWVAKRIAEKASRISNPIVLCMGLTYKPDIDDLRESPSIKIVEMIAEQGLGEILVAEPHIDEIPASLSELGVKLVDYKGAIRRADIVVQLVDHQVFRHMDKDLLKEKIVIDTCGGW